MALPFTLGITMLVILFLASMIFFGASPQGAMPSGGSGTASPVAAPGDFGPPVVAPSGLVLPVAGVRPAQLSDTYSQARSGGRVHDAIDIMAPAGTPVIAAADGTVEKLYFSNGGGGITAYVRSPDRLWTYYYAHLQSYARGLHEGQRIARGDAVGLVGSTGNASPEAPHLHFAINRMAPEERWYQGQAINPYPLLAGAGTRP